MKKSGEEIAMVIYKAVAVAVGMNGCHVKR